MKIKIVFFLGLILLIINSCNLEFNQNLNILEDTEQSISLVQIESEITHRGDLIINGTETFLIEDESYLQQGNIYINDKAKLVIKDSKFYLGRGDIPTIHTYIFVSEEAYLEINNSTLSPEIVEDGEMGGLVVVINLGKIKIIDAPTQIHLLQMSENSQLIMINSEMIYDIGGLLQIEGGKAMLINSTIASLGLKIPSDAKITIDGLTSGICYDSWDVHEMVPSADYDLIMRNSCILEDNFTGEYRHGPYERGWIFFLDSNSNTFIFNSEFRKIFINIIDDSVTFENLKMDVPSYLEYRNILLDNVTMMGQWPFWIQDSNLTLINSEYLFLQPTGNSTVYLKNSHLVEFIPRNFFGKIIFENSYWTNAGEIIGGEPYHSVSNDFLIQGSVKISEDVRTHLQWKNATVTREYEVLVKDNNGYAISKALIRVNDKEIETDKEGYAYFELLLDEANYNDPQLLEVFIEDKSIAQENIDFFTETPIIINYNL